MWEEIKNWISLLQCVDLGKLDNSAPLISPVKNRNNVAELRRLHELIEIIYGKAYSTTWLIVDYQQISFSYIGGKNNDQYIEMGRREGNHIQ